MNRNNRPSNKGKNIYLNACLLRKVPSKEHVPKLVCLATPAVLFVSRIAFANIGVLLTDKILNGEYQRN